MRIIIADAAISLVPESWVSDKSVKSYFQRHKRLPLMNASNHQHLLREIPKTERLDRPDILHFALMLSLDYVKLIPDLQIYFTSKEGLFQINSQTRLPRDQKRFYGLLETYLMGNASPFISRQGNTIDDITGPKVFFSTAGTDFTVDHLKLDNYVFGGFSSGHFKSTPKTDDLVVNLGHKPLNLTTAISFFLGKYLSVS